MYILSYRNLFQYPVNQPVRNTGKPFHTSFPVGSIIAKCGIPLIHNVSFNSLFLPVSRNCTPFISFSRIIFIHFSRSAALSTDNDTNSIFRPCKRSSIFARNGISLQHGPHHVAHTSQQNPRSLERRQIHPLPVHGLPR